MSAGIAVRTRDVQDAVSRSQCITYVQDGESEKSKNESRLLLHVSSRSYTCIGWHEGGRVHNSQTQRGKEQTLGPSQNFEAVAYSSLVLEELSPSLNQRLRRVDFYMSHIYGWRKKSHNCRQESKRVQRVCHSFPARKRACARPARHLGQTVTSATPRLPRRSPLRQRSKPQRNSVDGAKRRICKTFQEL